MQDRWAENQPTAGLSSLNEYENEYENGMRRSRTELLSKGFENLYKCIQVVLWRAYAKVGISEINGMGKCHIVMGVQTYFLIEKIDIDLLAKSLLYKKLQKQGILYLCKSKELTLLFDKIYTQPTKLF